MSHKIYIIKSHPIYSILSSMVYHIYNNNRDERFIPLTPSPIYLLSESSVSVTHRLSLKRDEGNTQLISA